MTFSTRTLHVYPDLFGVAHRNPQDDLLQERLSDAIALLLFETSSSLEDFKVTLLRDLTDVAPIRRELSNHAGRLSDHFMLLEMITARLGQAEDLGNELLEAMETFECLSLNFDYITHSPAPGVISILRPGTEEQEIILGPILTQMTPMDRLLNRFAQMVCNTSLTRIQHRFSELSWKLGGVNTDIDFVIQEMMMKKIFIS